MLSNTLVATVLAGLALAALTPGAAWGEGRRVIVATPDHTDDDDGGVCLAHALADGVTQGLARALTGDDVLDRRLARTLERGDGDYGADVVVRLAVARAEGGLTVRAVEPKELVGRAWSAPSRDDLIVDVTRDIAGALGGDGGAIGAIASYPADPGACAALSRALAAMNEPAKAQRLLADVLRGAPDQPQALVADAELRIRAGDLDGGIALARNALAAAPTLAEAHFAVGLGLDLSGVVHGARAAYRAANAQRPGLVAALVNEGLMALREGRLDEALTSLGRAGELAPTWGTATLNHAIALVAAHDGRAATDALARLPNTGPLATTRSLTLARAARLAGDTAETLRIAGSLSEIAPLRPYVLTVKAQALLAAREHELALAASEAAQAAVDANGERPELVASLVVVRALAQLGLGRRETALHELHNEAAADNAPTLVRHAHAVLSGADTAALATLAGEQPSDDELWYNLGVLRHRDGDATGAAEAYERAAKANPRAAWARYNRGVLALEQGETDVGLKWLVEAEQLAPTDADIQAALGAARARAEAP